MIPAEKLKILLDEATIEQRIKELGEEISRDFAGKELVLVCILKGGVIFMSQLAKSITVPVTMDFIRLSSYGNALISSGEVELGSDLDNDVAGKEILIVEDIVDSGRTLSFLSSLLIKRGARSVKICSLLDKPSRRVVPVQVDYCGFQIPDKFVLGYGLDYEQYYRNLPYVAYVEE